jgi:hypothetical protein
VLPKPEPPPELPALVVRFFVDGEPRRARVTIFAEPNPTPVTSAETPATLHLPRGTYSIRFEHEGLTHRRRDVLVWWRQGLPIEADFHW